MADRKKTIKEDAKIPKKSPRVALTDTIQEIYLQKGYNKEDIPWSLLMSQVKSMERDYKLTDNEIRQTINYMITFENKDISDMDTLGLVPFYVDKCKSYIVQYKENKRKSKEFEFDDEVNIVVKHGDKSLKKRHETFD